ncbi:MAG: hypothetical protein JWO90_1053 [Solirubrobacterales bacterium]|nr:hypothetical protein [Solirubrobacterales bacterium]
MSAGWPPIEEPGLRERLAMDDAAFAAFMLEMRRSVPARRFTPEVWATAVGYPWERPARSYLLDGERVELLEALPAARRRALLEGRASGPDGGPRYPLLAFGSNGAPSTLQRKFAHLDASERRVLVLAGELRGFDVGAVAHPTSYGSMAASLFESPGTAVRAAVLMVTAVQLTQLCWTEIGYRFGRLDHVAFAADEDGLVLDAVFAYAARLGTFSPDGEPLALGAIPAAGRTAKALGQEELLTRAAALMLGEGATAEALVRRIFEGLAGLPPEASARIAATGRPFAPPTWTPWSP